MHGLRLGDAILVTLGAEAFVEFALFGRDVLPAKEVLVLGYTDGNAGYICTANVYAEGGYEAQATEVAPQSEQIVKDAMQDLLHKLATE